MLPRHLHNEQELLVKLGEGDEYAFEQLYLIYSPKIYRKILQLVKNTALAEELLQDVFVKIWEKRETLNNQKSFKSYLYTIAKNMVVDLFRKAALDRQMLEKFIVENTEFYYPFEHLEDMDVKSKLIVQRALDTLPPQRKRIYTLIKLEGKSYEEVAELLSISTSTINDHVVKATKSLRCYFDENNIALVALLASILIS
ncbi:RNA polymerase sigma factor [Pedobacter borealis]|uniref:RNA polymerase sigma factor n=1 Tax=Pedobacter borealis TaxID=475254 RepID=UPI0004933CD6|nr:RNA polymerase sigma-70 factor [Pedobacter borealis]